MARPRQSNADETAASTNVVPNDVPARTGSFVWLTAMPSWLTSMVLHIIVLLLMAMMTLPKTAEVIRTALFVSKNPTEDVLEEFEDTLEVEPVEMEVLEDVEFTPDVDTELIADEAMISTAEDLDAAAIAVELDPLGLNSAVASDLTLSTGATMGSGVSGRGQAARKQLVKEAGGSAGSEAAVAEALKWLANHQLPDGGWDLNHQLAPSCQGQCSHPGEKTDTRIGATSLALLPFLGAGQTHTEGDYKLVVRAGLDFLIRSIRVEGNQAIATDGGNYYSHGLTAIVFCEAYAMTKDPALAAPAQALINETVVAQDPFGGGWRYSRKQAGDTSAVGWQLMALKSAHMAYLAVPAITVQKASAFLDQVQLEDGAKYRYVAVDTQTGEVRTQHSFSTTAVGLLMRMYLGWKHDHPILQKGVALVSKHGPSVGPESFDMYYNYYASQIMRHYGGDEWEKWNPPMRDFLVNSQEQNGHEKGSWFFARGSHNDVGGRLYSTSLCTMILEVYYRHMPIYQQDAAEEEFPL